MPLVIAVAIVSNGRVLAARRAAPSSLSGGWELPGGKAEPGESPQEAGVREIVEELGCVVRIGDRVPGERPLGAGLVMHAYEAALVSGEPVPHEHDALRWLGPDELDEVAWLPADVPFVCALRPRLYG